jgi:hypothetical protein
VTLVCLVPGPGTQIPVGRIRIDAELSDSPRFYWQGHWDWRWFEAASLAEATARALGYRDLEDAHKDTVPCEDPLA